MGEARCRSMIDVEAINVEAIDIVILGGIDNCHSWDQHINFHMENSKYF